MGVLRWIKQEQLSGFASLSKAPMYQWGAPCGRFSAANLRRQSRQRHSSPATGIGSRAVSSAHQHEPPGLQVNSVPQREQMVLRGSCIPNRFVMN
jgi:hypothetical protein